MDYGKLPYVKAYVDGTFYNGMYGGGYVIMDPDNNIIFQDCGIGKNDPELYDAHKFVNEILSI